MAHVVSRVESGNVVKVYFHDGHNLTFQPGEVGLREPTAIGRVYLEKAGHTVIMFHSGRQYPVSYTPFGFIRLTSGYTRADFAAYWSAAQQHVNNEFGHGRLRDAQAVVTLGRNDLLDIKADRWPAPASRPGRR